MSNNHSLEERKIAWPFTLVSNVLIAFGFLFIANGVGAVLMALYLGGKPDLDALSQDPHTMKNALLIGQIGGTLVGMLLIPSLYIFYIKKELKEIILVPSWKQISFFLLAAACITFVIMPLVGIIGDWNKDIQFPPALDSLSRAMHAMEDEIAKSVKLIVAYDSTGEMLLVLFTVALLPAVAEELMFRGIILNDLKKTFNIHWSVFISAFIFSFIHLQFFGFFPRLLLGIVLGYLYITSGNILVSMLMHFINNAVVVIALNLHAKGVLKIDPESSKDIPAISIYISIILSSALLYSCWRMYKLRTDTEKTNV